MASSNDTAEVTEDAEIAAYNDNEKNAPRLSFAQEARTMVELAKHGFLSTLVSAESCGGFPNNSVVQFCADSEGRPVFCVSTLSMHTRDLMADPRCSLLVQSEPFTAMSDARFTLTGTCSAVSDEEKPALREAFLKKYPDAFYVDFGDFHWFRMDELKMGQFNGGFGRAGRVKPADYQAASPDPVAPFAIPVASHMNDDHADSTAAMVGLYAGIKVDSAKILNLDSLGMNVACAKEDWNFKCRVGWVRPIESRKDIKDVIVEMTRAAAAASQASEGEE